jgi:hypothetical protein
MALRQVKVKSLARNMRKYIELMEQRGYKVIGKGSYATVLHKKGSKQVLKVFSHDAGYERFLRVITRYKSCIYPKVGPLKKHLVNGKISFSSIRIEKLSPISRNHKAIYTLEAIRYRPPNLHIFNPEEIKAIRRLTSYRHSKGSWDIHSGNVMVRGKQVVIIDPYYS